MAQKKNYSAKQLNSFQYYIFSDEAPPPPPHSSGRSCTVHDKELPIRVPQTKRRGHGARWPVFIGRQLFPIHGRCSLSAALSFNLLFGYRRVHNTLRPLFRPPPPQPPKNIDSATTEGCSPVYMLFNEPPLRILIHP